MVEQIGDMVVDRLDPAKSGMSEGARTEDGGVENSMEKPRTEGIHSGTLC
jgi:hypothetical protein